MIECLLTDLANCLTPVAEYKWADRNDKRVDGMHCKMSYEY